MLEDSDNDRALALRAAQRGRENLTQVQFIYAGMKDELQGDRFWRYQRQVSPGLQEYIEALSFVHYLEHGSLVTFDQVQQTICDPDTGVPVRPRNHSHVYPACIMPFVTLSPCDTVLPVSGLRLPSRPLRSHRRTHAVCDLCSRSTGRAGES